MADITKTEAREYLKTFEWYHPEASTAYCLIRIDRDGTYRRLKDALDVLGMGYHGDFTGIGERDRDHLVNLIVDAYQFKRAEVYISELKTTTTMPEATEAPTKRRKKATT